MAQTSAPADTAEILKKYIGLHFTAGAYHYQIQPKAGHFEYTITDGKQTRSATLLWSFGNGRVGQSYLFKKPDGKFYEARVTYFATLKNLEFTPGRALDNPKDIDEAMYRPVPQAEAEHCFDCHTTASSIRGEFDESKLYLGVSCEACHGPGAKHVAAANVANMSGVPDAARGTILNPSSLSPEDSVDFCGACHASFWDVKLSGAKGVSTAKSQPYRLEESKCWGKGDARLTCIACHDPHVPLQTDTASYDASCLRCHAVKGQKQTAEQSQKACPVSTNNCTGCHMPKVYVPEMHYAFTDHRIRIAREGEPYPD